MSEIVTPKRRGSLTVELLLELFDKAVKDNEDEIENRRNSPTKNKQIKYLKTIGKVLKNLKNKFIRFTKQKKHITRTTKAKSGLNKSVPISKDMAKFGNWDPQEEKSRTEVTRFLCKYIEENGLRKETDKREIIPDVKLSKLLGYNKKTDPEPLNYWRMQIYMKKAGLFIKK